MSLIIHELATDQAEYYGVFPTISSRGETKSGLNMIVTVETREDLPLLFQYLDTFINKHTNLLPDYADKQIPVGRMAQIVIFTGKYVTIIFYDVPNQSDGITITYEVPLLAQKPTSPPVTRYRTLGENPN